MDSFLGRSISFGPFRLYPGARVLERAGVRIDVGSRALDIVIVLAERAGDVVSHRDLTQRVWRGLVVTPSNLRVHIAALRKALGEDRCASGEPQYIANVPGQGYCLLGAVYGGSPDEEASVHAEAIPASTDRAPLSPKSRPPSHNLPNQRTSLIGRERETQQIAGLLNTTQLLTLTGAGGCGKTRLALHLAERVLNSFPHGCRLVELAPLGEPELVACATATALGVAGCEGLSCTDAIIEHVGSGRLLLVLDNAEHLLQSCADLVDALLRRCPALTIVVTSREPLGVAGELTYRVPSLSMPGTDDVSMQSVLACEAARLFVDRARLRRADFEITEKNVASLKSICRRLDGIALAIELAASCTRAMSLEELDSHLDDRFDILTGGHRSELPRHRTLRALIDWSYALLGPAERMLLRRAAVFPGGLTVEAAERVCEGAAPERGRTVDLLTALTDKSLMVAEARDDVTWFCMNETVREYARQKLRESGEEDALLARHREYIAPAEQPHVANDRTGTAPTQLDDVRAWRRAQPNRRSGSPRRWPGHVADSLVG